MAQPEGPQRVKVGVLLARQVDDLGEWLAEAGAFDAAGADALWIHLGNVPELEPLAVTAALAAVTVRATLVAVLAAGDASPASARTLATIARLSHGRLRIARDIPSSRPGAPGGAQAEPGSGGAEHPQRPTAPRTVVDHVAPGYELEAAEGWTSMSYPDGRDAWRAKLAEAAERGVRGVVVPADPRLIDVLRNPDDAGGRMDLYLAQG